MGRETLTPRSSEQNVRIESKEHPGERTVFSEARPGEVWVLPFYVKRFFTAYLPPRSLH